MLVSSTALALHPFPPFDPAYFKPGALPPVLTLAPLDVSQDNQLVDGSVDPVAEYAGGRKEVLEDWYTAMPPGDMHLKLAGHRLILGFRVNPGDCGEQGCLVAVAVDEDREATLAHPGKLFGPEDRGFFVSWTTPTNMQVGQWSGLFPVGKLPSGEAWPVMAKVGLGNDGNYHVELKITMRTTSANTYPDPNPRTQPFGLAVAVIGRKQEHLAGPPWRMDPSYYIWPNKAVETGGQWIAIPKYPYTYMTVQPEFPSGPVTGFLTYNVGMLPFLPDGGDGTPGDFAAYAAAPEVQVACFQEVWDHGQRKQIATLARELAGMDATGLPNPCGGADDQKCSAGELIEQSISDTGILVKDTGLLLLSKSPIIASAELRFHEGCLGADCFEDKGALWARVAPTNAKLHPRCGDNPDIPQACPPDVYAGEKYIDVFCTHLQANCDQLASPQDFVDAVMSNVGDDFTTQELLSDLGVDPSTLDDYYCGEEWYEPIQNAQIRRLGTWINQIRSGGADAAPSLADRPAVLMGDFNIDARSLHNLWEDGNSRYKWIAEKLGAFRNTEFEKKTEGLFSGRHDINLGFHEVFGSIPPVRGTDPVLVRYVHKLAQMHANESPLPIQLFGESTKAEENAQDHDFAGWRYDYVWVLPPSESDELPFYAIAAKPEEPFVTVDLHADGDSEPASDHAAVYANLRFVDMAALNGYNPMRNHHVRQAVTFISTLSDDGYLSGGEDFYGHGNSSFGGFTKFSAPDDSDAVWVDWGFGGNIQPDQQIPASWWFDLWEDDTSSDDQYDMQSWAGLDVQTVFYPNFSAWQFLDTSQNPTVEMQVCLAGLAPHCPTVPTMKPVVQTYGTASESAVVTHQLTVKELP